MFVQHLRGTTECNQTIKSGHGVIGGGGGTWISQWKNIYGESALPSKCPGCHEKKQLFGCHVCIPNSDARFICPMCKNCNECRYGEWIKILGNIPLLKLKECEHGYLENNVPPLLDLEPKLNPSPSNYYQENQVTNDFEDAKIVAETTAVLITPLINKTEENFKSKGGKIGGYVGGSICGVSVTIIIIILVIVALLNGWNPVGWALSVALAFIIVCTCCGCCVWSSVGKNVQDSYETV